MDRADGFEATFRVRISRDDAWTRLTGKAGPIAAGEHLWLAGFDSEVSVVEADPAHRLCATKDDEPCAGTDIVVTLDDDAGGTRIHVVQSRFGDWLPDVHDMMAIGWRFIVADLQAYLATGAHPRRHLRPWGDLGAEASPMDGGIHLDHVRAGGLAERLGIANGDILVSLSTAPVATLDDVTTVLRAVPSPVRAEWIRGGVLMTAPAGSDGRAVSA